MGVTYRYKGVSYSLRADKERPLIFVSVPIGLICPARDKRELKFSLSWFTPGICAFIIYSMGLLVKVAPFQKTLAELKFLP